MLKRLILIVTSLVALSAPVLSPIHVFADAKDDVCAGVGAVSGASGCDPKANSTVNNIIRTALRIMQVIAGLLAVFYLINAGLKFITSSGSSEGVKSARSTIIFTAVGIIIVLLSEAIIRFVLNRFS